MATVLAGCAVLGLAACSQPSNAAGNSGAGTTAPTTPPSSSTTTTTTFPAQYVTVAGHRIQLPTERPGGPPISKSRDEGDQILIESTGMVPATMYAWDGNVVWTNLTGQTQILSVEDNQIHSTPIPPGGTWTWKARGTIAFEYSTQTGIHGLLYLGQFPK